MLFDTVIDATMKIKLSKLQYNIVYTTELVQNTFAAYHCPVEIKSFRH